MLLIALGCTISEIYLYLQKTEPETIMEDLKRDISRGIEQFCRCKFSTDYITNESLTCHGETLAFEGRVISTDDRDSSNLVSDMQKWLSSGPTVIARGEQLKVVNIDTKVEMNSSTNNGNTTVEVPVFTKSITTGTCDWSRDWSHGSASSSGCCSHWNLVVSSTKVSKKHYFNIE